MAQTSWNKPGYVTSSNRTGGAVAWTNAMNASGSDNVYATAAIASNTTHYLLCSNFGFTVTDIPSGSTIDGLECRYEGKASTGGSANMEPIGPIIYWIGVRSNTVTGTEQSYAGVGESVPTVEATSRSYGSSAVNIWGFTDVTAIAASSGIAMAYFDDTWGTTTLSMDTIEIRFTYTAPVGGGGGGGATNTSGSFFGLLT
jgi:hypothetical protein